jgi:hypothetical protein
MSQAELPGGSAHPPKDGVIAANKCRPEDRLANRLIPFG